MENPTGSSSYVSSSYTSERRKEWEERRRQMKEQETEKIERIKEFLKSHPPSRIEAELNECILDQPSLTKNVADFLYYHALKHIHKNLPARPLLICGPSGSGKTTIWYTIQNIYSDIFKVKIIDSSNLSQDGWSGTNKISNYLTRDSSNTILVFDEFDKCASPQITSAGRNVSADIQSEFLKLIESNEYTVTSKGEIEYTTSNLSCVFVGAFESVREEKTKPTSSAIGFCSQIPEMQKYNGINRNDLLDFGVLAELLGRISLICQTRPMSKEQCVNIIRNSKSRVNAIASLLEENGIDAWSNLSDEVILKIIEESNIEKFGVRNVISKIETIMLRGIHEHGLTNIAKLDKINEHTNTN